MSPLEKKKLEVEKAKLSAGLLDQELKILEREEDIKRILENMEVSKERIQEIGALLKGE